MATIFARWQGVLARIRTAVTTAQRPDDSVRLLAVSKTFPATDIAELYACGQRDFGENYVQELGSKAAELAQLSELRWHFIGPLQSNKTRSVAEIASWVHAVDRLKIAERLSSQRPEHLPPLQVCLQVNVSGEASKSGVAPAEVAALAQAVSTLPRMQLRGLMCIPEATDDSVLLAGQFRQLRTLLEQLNAQGLQLDTLSMGMSADLELAVAEGATMVRIGTALFGRRS
ncbi:YggS family pyridoxal phosphate-dependent enzyme [Andreprevotia lacus]|jgi:pyridoxal phosphate enzyme (YggS family)|uniref:YggS family pyridoxal phosphate-dependent enzyme n=1 Tax=Andreprevotia lacus TaxID=1121000 RepID=UPI0009FF0E75|nr:YggS family pyridoxal phosphate-dependent enzyme [Andreprevotia lacus]